MEISLEQFIASDKSKSTIKILKIMGTIMIVIGLLFCLNFSLTNGLLMQIIGAIVFISGSYVYVDYEYEFFDGNIDISKIYSCRKRKLVQRINKESVIRVYVTPKSEISNNKIKKFFNSNIKNLTIYTFEIQNNKKIQIALNEKIEKIVKIVYRQKISVA